MLYVLTAWLAAASTAEPRWTFCVAEAGDDAWITEVFAPARERETLEKSFASLLRARGVSKPSPQCPAPSADKEEVFNAQYTAAEFQRKLGRTLHAVAWPPQKR